MGAAFLHLAFMEISLLYNRKYRGYTVTRLA